MRVVIIYTSCRHPTLFVFLLLRPTIPQRNILCTLGSVLCTLPSSAYKATPLVLVGWFVGWFVTDRTLLYSTLLSSTYRQFRTSTNDERICSSHHLCPFLPSLPPSLPAETPSLLPPYPTLIYTFTLTHTHSRSRSRSSSGSLRVSPGAALRSPAIHRVPPLPQQHLPPAPVKCHFAVRGLRLLGPGLPGGRARE